MQIHYRNITYSHGRMSISKCSVTRRGGCRRTLSWMVFPAERPEKGLAIFFYWTWTHWWLPSLSLVAHLPRLTGTTALCSKVKPCKEVIHLQWSPSQRANSKSIIVVFTRFFSRHEIVHHHIHPFSNPFLICMQESLEDLYSLITFLVREEQK